MAEIANEKLRNILKPLIELFIRYSFGSIWFFGLVVLVPLIQKTFHLGVGETALAGSIILGIMALPTIITISEDANPDNTHIFKGSQPCTGSNRQFANTYAGNFALFKIGNYCCYNTWYWPCHGRNLWQWLMVYRKCFRNPTSFLQPVRTIPATIAAELGETSYGGVHFKALFALGSYYLSSHLYSMRWLG